MQQVESANVLPVLNGMDKCALLLKVVLEVCSGIKTQGHANAQAQQFGMETIA